MHGPLPPDVTLDAPHWWQPGMPLLPPADYRAPVPLKRKRDTSEAKTDPAKRAYMRIPDEAKLWFQDFHTLIKRVSMASHSLTTFAGRSIWCRSSSGPWHPTHSADGTTAARLTTAADHPWRLPPFALSHLANLTHARRGQAQSQRPHLAARLPPCAARARHRIRAQKRVERSSFFTACSSHGNSRRLAPAASRAADIARERNFLQLRVNYLCDRFGISQDRIWNLDETAVRIVPTGERGWTKKAESVSVFASRAFVTVTLAANMRDGMWTQIVYEEKSDRVHPHEPHFPRQLVSHSPTHWITQDALLDMIDAIDADMHARPGDAERTPWLLVLDCAPQRIAAEFRSIMRDTRPHIKLCYVQRNFTGYTQPLDRAYMRAFKNSIRQEVAKHFAVSNFERVNRTCQSGLQHRSAPTAAALIRAHSRTERRQPATSNRWLALHRLERGGAA